MLVGNRFGEYRVSGTANNENRWSTMENVSAGSVLPDVAPRQRRGFAGTRVGKNKVKCNRVSGCSAT